ncbi:MAG: hypothetical protein AAFY33_12235 [Cyanobacteria bacterium J06643_4]
MIKRALILLMAGFCFFPAVAGAEEVSTEQGAAATPAEPVPDAAESVVIIEDLLEPVEGSAIAQSYTFTGNANEMIVISVEPPSGYESAAVYTEPVRLASPVGGLVYGQYDNSLALHLGKPNGYHRVFLLPETGEYQLTFDADFLSGFEGIPASGYLLQVRQASYYARLINSANYLMGENPEQSLALLALAIAHNPDLPEGYYFRLGIYAQKLFAIEAFEQASEVLNRDDEEGFFNLVHTAFLTFSPEEQRLILNDLRQLDRTYAAQFESLEAPSASPNAELFLDIARFLETGVPTESVRALLFGTAEGGSPE